MFNKNSPRGLGGNESPQPGMRYAVRYVNRSSA